MPKMIILYVTTSDEPYLMIVIFLVKDNNYK
jgi:hypothetical protein